MKPRIFMIQGRIAYLSPGPLDGQSQQTGCLLVGHGSVARITQLVRKTSQCVDHCEDRQGTSLPGVLDGSFSELLSNAGSQEYLLDLLGIVTEPSFHGLLDHPNESVATLITLFDQRLDDSAYVAKRIVNPRRMLPGELHDFGCIPHDMVRTNLLKPKCGNAHRPATDLGVPQVEPWGKRLAVDFGPSAGVDHETEHVLFPGIQPGAAVDSFGRSLEINGVLLDHAQQVGVVQPGVARAVDRPKLVVRREQLQGLIAPRQRLGKRPGRRVRAEPIDRLLGNTGQPTKLAETPSVHLERPIVASQRQPTGIGGIRLDQSRRNPAIDTHLLLPLAMLRQCRKRLKTLVRLALEQFTRRLGKILHHKTPCLRE